ncbi:MAG: PqiC family protein [Puniceicoccales bacterium]|jgi:uncharacterized lipoprotein YmbA|nr:PqiC family protein [Puniceicoccales bacterium]
MKKFLILILTCLLNCGCLFSPQKDMSKFYALGLSGTTSSGKCLPIGAECMAIGLSVESIPAYSDMAQIVKLRDGCEVVQSELHRWAEPIKCGIARSLLNHLGSALGGKYILVPLVESSAARAYEYKVHVGFTNFIFNEDNSELLLAANVSIFKRGKLVAICDYSDRFRVGAAEYKKIVNGMDWALKMLGGFIARCIDRGCAGDIAANIPVPMEIGSCENGGDCGEKVSQGTEAFPRIINISARGEVYVVVDSAEGTHRYFSGRLFKGSSINVKCDAPYKITSTNDELIEVK